MTLRAFVKRIIQTITGKRPKPLTAQIVRLAPTELLKDRVALITGGTSGIGYAIADAMLTAGAGSIVITGRSEERCKAAVEKLLSEDESRQGRIFYQVMDNRNVSAFEENFKKILEKLSAASKLGSGLSILCNNAGSVNGVVFGTATEERYDEVLDTNQKGLFFLTQAVANYMVDNNIQGNILNIGSSSSLRPSNSAYCLSKVGIKEFTLGIAKTLISHGIVVNGIGPGPTVTPAMEAHGVGLAMPSIPLGRCAMPEEIANMAVFLTSEMGRTIVGSMVYMTGGSAVTTYDDVSYPFPEKGERWLKMKLQTARNKQ